MEVDIRPQALHVLQVLVQNSGRHVNYDQMIHEAWNGTLVSKHTVAVTVGEVKKILGEFGPWISYRPRMGYCFETPHSDDLVRQGWHCWNRGTREGFEKALCYFQRAARETNDPRAFEGASLCYMMLGTCGMRPAREMYQGFLDAHRRAVALSGLTPDLRADRAQGLHIFEHKIAEAEADLLQALREKPRWVPAHMGLIMLYSGTGRLDEALQQVEEVRAIDPLWVQLPASEVFVRFFRRELPEALAAARQAWNCIPICLWAGRFTRKLWSFPAIRRKPSSNIAWPRFFVPTSRGCGRWKRCAWRTAAGAPSLWRFWSNWKSFERPNTWTPISRRCSCTRWDEKMKRSWNWNARQTKIPPRYSSSMSTRGWIPSVRIRASARSGTARSAAPR